MDENTPGTVEAKGRFSIDIDDIPCFVGPLTFSVKGARESTFEDVSVFIWGADLLFTNVVLKLLLF